MTTIERIPPGVATTNSGPRPEPDSRPQRPPTLLSAKVFSRHLDRLAVVYVRQSSARQVLENRESTQLQYRLQDRAVALGWAEAQVLVIDEDLGQSGQSIAGRPGFQRLLAEVGLDHVGLVLGIEMSRLARSCRDWHQLLELCAVFGTLLGDADGVYDPRDYNDRLLLGLKGAMSEAELHVLRGRLEAGKRNKAQRGELFSHASIGYVRSPEDGLVLEPDAQARAVVALIFAQFAALGSAAAMLRYLNRHQIRIGVRDHRGPDAGRLVWRRPNIATVLGMLRHPVYAGAYVWGRRCTDPRKRIPGRQGSGRLRKTPGEWEVLLRDRLPAYISWEQYEANQRQLRDNSPNFGRGTPRDGCSLLGGLVNCGRCGRRMGIHYARRARPQLICAGASTYLGAPPCQSLTTDAVEALIVRQVLIALEPASLELSLAAADQIEADRQRLHDHHKQSLERARFEAERAWRQYTAVEPEHRLVARDLERRWEDALGRQRAAQEALERFRHEQPTRLTDAQRAQIRGLAADLPTLWHAPSTRPSDRQAILRHLLERVEVTVPDGKERVEVTLRWIGGYESRHEVRRPVSSYRRLHDEDAIRTWICELKHQGLSYAEVARRLNAEGLRGPSGREFTVPMVSSLWACARAANRSSESSTAAASSGPAALPLLWRGKQLADHLQVPPATLNTWRRRGWVLAQRGRRWVYWANEAELARLTHLRRHPRVALTPVPPHLTIPTGPPPWQQETESTSSG
jgi:DNA invertase Pin-like site-specific DNA recombinase